MFSALVHAFAWSIENTRQLVLSIAVLLTAAATAQAAEPPRSNDYHATVINGSIIGSSFMVAKGLAVTNAHVVSGRRPGDRIVLSSSRNARIRARVLAISHRMDLAILAVRESSLPIVPLHGTRQRPGDAVYAVGVVADSSNPRRRLIVKGQVTSKKRRLPPFGYGVIAKMPQIRKGFSGGPVFDKRGHLIGMVAAMRHADGIRSTTNEAFVLSIEDIRVEINSLLQR